MLIELLVILALVLLNGAFAGAEIALLSVRETRVRELVDEQRPGARSIAKLRADPERLLATVQVGITVVGASAAAIGGSTLADPLAVVLEPVAGAEAEAVAIAIVVAAISYLSLVLGELVPKSLALRAAEPYALLAAPALAAVAWVARPVVWVLTRSSNAVLRLFGDSTSFVEGRLSADELRQLLDEAALAGTVDGQAGEIASRALAFSELTVADVLVPRIHVVSLARDAAVAELAGLVLAHDHSRILVYGADPDDLVGYVSVRRVLADAARGDTRPLADHVQPLVFVPVTLPATTLLRDLQARRTQLAVAIDEQGTVRGIVTLEDLVEELIGDVLSKRERAEPPVVAEPDGRLLVLGSAPLHEVSRLLGVDLPEVEQSSTIAGLLLERTGRIPAVGEQIVVDRFRFEIVEATRRRVVRVRVAVSPLTSDPARP